MATKAQLANRARLLRKKEGLLPAVDPNAPSLVNRQAGATGTRRRRPDAPTAVQDSQLTPPVQLDAPRQEPFAAPEVINQEQPGVNAPVEDTRTFGEKAESLVGADLQATRAAEEKFFGKAESASTLEEFVGDFTQKQVEKKKAFEKRAKDAQTASEQQTSEARNRLEIESELASQALVGGGREGPESATAGDAAARLKGATGARIDRLIAQQDATRVGIQESRQALEEAQSAGRTDLATQLQSAIDQKEFELEQQETQKIQALTAMSAEERAQQVLKNSSTEQFMGVVNSGVELTPEGVQAMSEQYGIDFETSFNYYNATQSIRDNKKLDDATKAIEFARVDKEFKEELRGIRTKEAKAILDFETMSSSGDFTPDQLRSLAIDMGISNAQNPVFQAELRLKEANAKIKQAQANGEVIGPQAQLNYANDLYDYNEKTGTGMGSVPTGGGYGAQAASFSSSQLLADYNYQSATAISSGIRLQVEPGQMKDLPGTERREDWCGAFVNDALGTAFGDTFTDKMGLVPEPPIIAPEAGMAFVQATSAVWGHVGVVEWVDPVTGQMGVVESNWQTGEDGKGIISRRTMQITDAAGFVPSKNGVAIQGPNGGSSASQKLAEAIMDPTSNATLKDLTPTQKEQVLPLLNDLKNAALADGDSRGVMAASAGGSQPSDSFINAMTKANTVVTQVGLLSDKMLESELIHADEGNDSVLDLSPLSGWLAKKNPWNTDAQEIKAILTGTVPNLARGVFGEVGVLTDHDIKLYMGTLPNLTQTADVKKAVTALTLKVVQDSIEAAIDLQAAGGRDMSGYTRFYDKVDAQIAQIEFELGIVDPNRSGGQAAFDPTTADADEMTATYLNNAQTNTYYSDYDL